MSWIAGATTLGPKGFRSSKLNIKGKKWKPVNDFGNNSVFIGKSSSFLVRVQDDCLGIKPNCIYFMNDLGDQNEFAGHDRGNYRMKDRAKENRVTECILLFIYTTSVVAGRTLMTSHF
ncbi:hypothetical protein MLD38_018320 [Melastoma candidum]|uniref:Uncharacterized protein n=1 Tax=Melastoma candidum TaxID=119954 RepID=A0ACB9QTE0_9MYRT|nr:hypothetical protein MLD38_018320 [Melastoma candidum]